MSRVEGGYATARPTAAEQDRIAREERQASALRYFKHKGMENDIVVEILGLVDSPKPKRQPRKRIGGERS